MVDRRRSPLAVSRCVTLLRGLALAAAWSGFACARRDTAGSRPESGRDEAGRVSPAIESAAASAAQPAASASAPAPPVAALPAALSGEGLVALEVPGFQPAVVSVPLGTRGPRPVAVALHGNFDRPEWQCGVWRPIVGERGFVLCPRGVPRRDVPREMDRWEYTSQPAFAREIDAALAALAARFGAHVDGGPVLFIGFSLGAIYGAPLVQRAPARFPRAVLIEGGLGAWTPATARRFSAAGGQRLLFGCGQPDCMTRSKRMIAALEKAGLPARQGGDGKAGHTYDGKVAQVVADNWEWLVESDSRWDAEDSPGASR